MATAEADLPRVGDGGGGNPDFTAWRCRIVVAFVSCIAKLGSQVAFRMAISIQQSQRQFFQGTT